LWVIALSQLKENIRRQISGIIYFDGHLWRLVLMRTTVAGAVMAVRFSTTGSSCWWMSRTLRHFQAHAARLNLDVGSRMCRGTLCGQGNNLFK
jgi:hypothetical protein